MQRNNVISRGAILRRMILLILMIGFLTACTHQTTPLPVTVASVDISKYMGTWYEIASFPNYFQRGCSCTKATYTQTKNYVAVHNRCYKAAEQKYADAHAKASPVIGSHNSKLKVIFFWPFTGKYWILYVDKDYQHAVVGTPDRTYLWILSRTPTIDAASYQRLVSIAKQQGYPIVKLNKTVQGNCPHP